MAARKPTKKQRQAMARAQRRKALDQFFVVGRLVLLACLVLLFMRLPVLSNVLDLLGTFFP